MSRSFDIFRRMNDDEAWGHRAQHLEGSADYGQPTKAPQRPYPYPPRQEYAPRARYAPPPPLPPPTTYGVLPERTHPDEVWRGRNEEYDFWGFERHPHPSLWARVKGAFTGKGPKNYVRTDERIREDVCEHLSYHPYIDASDIEVIVRDGEVTLTGTVDGRMVKRAAEECCEHVHGVTDVHNHLRVKRAEQPSP